MADEILVDSSGFYAMLAKDDDPHASAGRVLREARRRRREFITTDYVLDEMATLLRARRLGHLTKTLFDVLEQSSAFRIEWTDSNCFWEVLEFFNKHYDQEWSFTDCLSFVTMKRLKLVDALTKDAHFAHVGFKPLLK